MYENSYHKGLKMLKLLKSNIKQTLFLNFDHF